MVLLKEKTVERLLYARKNDTRREDVMVTPDVRSQLQPPQPTADVAIASLSRSSLDTEHTGEHPRHPRGQYDIV